MDGPPNVINSVLFLRTKLIAFVKSKSNSEGLDPEAPTHRIRPIVVHFVTFLLLFRGPISFGRCHTYALAACLSTYKLLAACYPRKNQIFIASLYIHCYFIRSSLLRGLSHYPDLGIIDRLRSITSATTTSTRPRQADTQE